MRINGTNRDKVVYIGGRTYMGVAHASTYKTRQDKTLQTTCYRRFAPPY